jgi:hypothetical protein
MRAHSLTTIVKEASLDDHESWIAGVLMRAAGVALAMGLLAAFALLVAGLLGV